jgi:mono/diheme cytochrome c family protein
MFQHMRRLTLLLLYVIVGILSANAQTKKTTLPASSKSGLQATLNRGKLVYGVNCLSCHQADGGGVGNLNPPLYNTDWITGNKSKLVQMVLKGSRGQVEIDGETFHNTMPAQAHLTDQQIADVLTYIRNSFGNKASVVTPAEVKAVRAKVK